MNSERTNLQQALAQANQKQETILKKSYDLEIDLQRGLENTAQLCATYELKATAIGVLPTPPEGYEHVNFTQELNGAADNPVPDCQTLLRPALLQFKAKAKAECSKLNEDDVILEEKITRTKETIAELKESFEADEMEMDQADKDVQDAKEVSISFSSGTLLIRVRQAASIEFGNINAEMDRLQSSVNHINSSMHQGLMTAQAHFDQRAIEYVPLSLLAQSSRSLQTGGRSGGRYTGPTRAARGVRDDDRPHAHVPLLPHGQGDRAVCAHAGDDLTPRERERDQQHWIIDVVKYLWFKFQLRCDAICVTSVQGVGSVAQTWMRVPDEVLATLRSLSAFSLTVPCSVSLLLRDEVTRSRTSDMSTLVDTLLLRLLLLRNVETRRETASITTRMKSVMTASPSITRTTKPRITLRRGELRRSGREQDEPSDLVQRDGRVEDDEDSADHHSQDGEGNVAPI